MGDQLTRRTTIAGAAGLTLGLPLLAACGGSDTTGGGSAVAGDGSATNGTSTPSTTSSSGTTGGATSVLGPTSDVAVGGGKIYGDANVVVTQPEAGTFKAFKATCTHAGCQVAKVADGTIDCPCHGSRFSIADGSVESGPAPSPLPEVGVTVTDGRIALT